MTWRTKLAKWLTGDQYSAFTVNPNLITDDGWKSHGRRHDRDHADIRSQYDDALTAWRKNPMAWRIIQITTDYTVGEGIKISSPNKDMQRFIEKFWFHPENRIGLRLEGMAEELARSGDLFPLLFREKHTGMSLLRFLTKDEVLKIETKKSDWEKETAVIQATDDPTNPKRWVTPHSHARQTLQSGRPCTTTSTSPSGPSSANPTWPPSCPGCSATRRMLEDRVRFHWATRLFLWMVRVPRNRVAEKAEQYRRPPDAGSIIVHDESEEWEVKSPVIRGADAAPDLKAVRNMIDGGSGYPPHWRGEATDVNLATAQAMQEPAERHLARRQNYFIWLLQDITYQAYQRAHQVRPQLWPAIEENRYHILFNSAAPDVSRTDNQVLAQATNNLAAAFAIHQRAVPQLRHPAQTAPQTPPQILRRTARRRRPAADHGRGRHIHL